MTSASSFVFSGSLASQSDSPPALAPSPAGHVSSATFSDSIDPRAQAIADLVGNLRRCEALAGELVAAQGQLAAVAIRAEGALGLSATLGQRVIAAFGAAQASTIKARGDLVAGHRRLETLGNILKIDMSDYGDTGKGPTYEGSAFVGEAASIPVA